MPFTGAERQKRYIERLKIENPLKYEEKRKTHLEKVKKRQKKIQNLSETEKNIQRKKWREANKRKKDKKVQVLQKENEEKLKKRRELRAALYKSKLKKENEELRREVTELNKKNLALYKKLYRYKKKVLQLRKQTNNQTSNSNALRVESIPATTDIETLSSIMQVERTPLTTPVSKTMSFIDSLTPIPDEDKNKIKKKIFELNVLSDSLRSQYKNANTNEVKGNIKKIADNEITAKYRMKTNLSTKLGLKGRIRIRAKKPYKNILEENIKNFFLRDDISRFTAGRSETKTLNKIKMQKRYLTDTLDNLYIKYKSEGGKGSRTTFGRYRPFFVLTPNVNDRDTCLCTKHTNLQFKVDKLKVLGILKTNSLSQLVKEVACDYNSKVCMYSFCEMCKGKMPEIDTDRQDDKKEICWYQWILRNHEYVKGQPGCSKTIVTKRYSKDKLTGTVETLVNKFIEELHVFKRHFFNIATQLSAFKLCKETVKEDEIIIICDFSENFTCKMSSEIQSAHFGASKNQFTLHTGVIYLQGNNPTSFCTISPSISHDPGAIWAHLKPIINYAKEKCPMARVIHIFSDGPSTQYRQKKNFFLFNKIIGENIFDYGTWSFFEAAHGKGPADGVGGAVKRKLDKLVAYGHDIPSAEAAYDLLKSQETEVKIFYVPEEDIIGIQNTIPDNLRPLPGTIQVHQIITKSNDGSIFYRDISCYCGSNNRGLCTCFDLKKHNLIHEKKIVAKKRSAKKFENKPSKGKRKTDSTDTETDSDVTYAETSESEGYEISEDKSEDEGNITGEIIEKVDTEFMDENELLYYNKQSRDTFKHNNIENEQNTYRNEIMEEPEVVDNNIEIETYTGLKHKNTKIKPRDVVIEKKIKMDIITDSEISETETKKTKISRNKEEKENRTERTNEVHELKRNLPSCSTNIKILSDIEVENVLDEITGEFILKVKKNEVEAIDDQVPQVGKFILAKFYTKHSKKIYRYVCLIEDVYGDSLVVKGLKSKKVKNSFRIVDDDISIIDLKDIIAYLPPPIKQNDNYIFRSPIDVNEA